MYDDYKNQKALVLASGGQDSTTCLYWARKQFQSITAITFIYNQKHDKEVHAAESICKKLDIDNKVVDISFLKELVVSNLFKDTGDINQGHPLNNDLPSSFVPYRNLIFLTLASAWAATTSVRHLVAGFCQTDYSGYPDCRDVFVKAAQAALNLAVDFNGNTGITIHTPLMGINKADEFKMAEDLGCLDVILKETLSCYNGVETINDFGKGCGACPACELRKRGYNDYVKRYTEK